MTEKTDNLRVDGARLLRHLTELAEIGATGDGGCRRLALSDEDRRGRNLVVSWMRNAGMAITIDRIGNIVGLWPPTASEPPVMAGSHIDTVATGGKYDGALGVLGALEVVETLRDAGITPKRPIAVAIFTNEEGSRFHPDMLGSLVYAGALSVADARAQVSVDGVLLGEALDDIGYAGETAPGAIRPAAYVELHIEQGPILDREGGTIGAVENLQGICWSELTIEGEPNHAGTTPMAMRKDAGLAAARIAVALNEMTTEMGGGQVVTVGRMEIEPNYINVIPKRVRMTVDLRNPHPERFALAQTRMTAILDDVAKRGGVTITRRSLAQFEPVVFDPAIVETVEAVARGQGCAVRRMTSGAGHDAQMMARLCPTAMIFVPSIGGLSHNPKEETAPEHLVAGANVLLGTLLRLTER